MRLEHYLNQKSQEYAPFDPLRAKMIYARLKPYLKLPKFKIHILGTNGKGSTGRYLTQGILENQKSVLHFTSPHLFDFRERFYKNGCFVAHQELENAHLFLQQFDFIQTCSYFEYATFLAFVLSSDVEYLVMEAGLGGEFDSTSCIDYEVSIFTLIGLDHQEFLGQDIREIARTKLRAMSGDTFLAIQKESCVVEIAKEEALSRGIHLRVLQFEDILKHCKKDFLKENLLSACEVLKFLKMNPLKNIKLHGLRGRFERIADHIMIDVGHNVDAARVIAQAIGEKKQVLVYNSYRDKNIQEILEILKPHITRVLIFPVSHPRVIARGDLCKILDSLHMEYEDFKDINPDDSYLVFGSFSLVQAFLEYYSKIDPKVLDHH